VSSGRSHCDSYLMAASLTNHTALDDSKGILGLFLCDSVLSNNGASSASGQFTTGRRLPGA
jgi:hypothetical protein